MQYNSKTKENAEKAQKEQDKQWEDVHGINRHENQRLLLSGFHEEYGSNEEWYRDMKIDEAIRKKARETERGD